jgi:hypothetical protein
VEYRYKIDDGDITSQVARDSASPISVTDLAAPGAGLVEQGLKAVGTNLIAAIPLFYANVLQEVVYRTNLDDVLNPGTNVKLPEKRNLTNGLHTATVYATTTQGIQHLLFACGSKAFKISNNDPTSAPTTGGGTQVRPGGGGGATASGSGQTGITLGGPYSPAGGILCDGTKGVLTAVGCVHTEPTALVADFFKLATGIGGGIAFLLMVLGAFQMITSAGNPEALKAGQERFRDAIIGLLFVVFSVLLLKFIGVDILGFGNFLGVTGS